MPAPPRRIIACAALLVAAVPLYCSHRTAPSVTLTAAEVEPPHCKPHVRVHFTSASPAVLDDTSTLGTLAACIRDGRIDHVTIDTMTDVPRAQQVAAALVSWAVSSEDFWRVRFADGHSLCKPEAWSCWRERRAGR